ncbi:diacylglycerol/lipid kinase family protein [Actinosynnema pretiosum]|uniref:VlmJ-like protein n=1 Tax=Actinosynnema pretiosum TaxID=42197 RepID=A0A290Z854_9PSEU|nr:diacylglycerol kinase family protein [Actinosynnema pretiosum]ATE55207.1 VlmJ-like protein [Actinosynnema pretiosum]
MEQRLRVVAVVNPAAGGDGDRVVAALEAVGAADVEVVRTTAPGDATDIAHKLASGDRPPDVVVSVGGDGTACQVATGLFHAGEAGLPAPPLLIAPGGTGNSAYRGLWDDQPWEQVAATALTGGAATRRLDLARIAHNGDLVLLGSGSGLFAATLLAIRGRAERGRELLMAAAVAAMDGYAPYPGRVTVDGEVVHEGGVVETIIGGFRHRGGLLDLVPGSVLDDGKLDITVVTAEVDMRVFSQAAVGGDVHAVPGVRAARGDRIRVERLDGQPLLFEHDGEVMPEDAPACDVEVVPAALAVLASPRSLPWFGRG